MTTCKQVVVGTFSSCAEAAKAVRRLVKANIDIFKPLVADCESTQPSREAQFRLRIIKEKSFDDLTPKGMFIAILSGTDQDIDRIQLS